jgi:hypothetical protein
VLLGKIFTACLAVGSLVCACSAHQQAYRGPASSAGGGSSLTASVTRDGEMSALTARGVVDALDRSGFAVPNPLDTTAQECPAAGCEQSIVTDTLRVKSFRTTAQAQTYAADRGLDQVATVVVAFAPPVSKDEQARYWAQIQMLMR